MRVICKQSFLAAALVGALASSSSPVAAQDAAGTVAAPKLEESSERPFYRSLTLGLEAGTTGLGGYLSWRFADHWGVRTGFDYFEYTDSGYAIKDLNFDAKIRWMSEPLTLDIYPWQKHSFHISVGVQFNQNRLTGSAVDTGTVIPTAKLGTLDLEIEQQLVNPYLGIGGNFLYFDRAHHWALGGELGVAYTGDPKVSLTRSIPSSPAIDAALGREEKRIQDFADQFKWWPVAKLMVNYSF